MTTTKLFILLLTLSTACAGMGTPAPQPTATPTSSAAPLPTISATPAPALVPTPSDSTRLLLNLPFQVGVTHVASNYRFSNINFMTEGADAAQQLNAKAVFVYLSPDFRSNYPDFPEGTLHWPVKQPTSLTELVQTAPYADLISRFQVIVFTAWSFANWEGVMPYEKGRPNWDAERKELHDLTQYLLTAYAGTGKVFILKGWENDNLAAAFDDDNFEHDLPAENVTALIAWLSARQEGVEQARREMGPVEGVMVYHAVECNRVLDILAGLIRTCNAVVPEVAPDLVTYSSYDSTASAYQDLGNVRDAFTQALNTIDRLAPDPLGLGKARIVISEFGLHENEAPPGDVIPRAQAVLETAQAFGLKLAFVWQLYDNECADQNSEPLPTALMVGDPRYPANEQCRGLWLYRPDGSPAEVLPLLQNYYWTPPQIGPTPWKPTPNTTWQIQFADTPVDQSVDAEMYDIDLFDSDESEIAALHAQGRRVVCYLNAGSWEEWRSDANQFPPDVLGKDYSGWPGEKWLDIRRIDLLGPIMQARLDLCKAKGFDGVDPDNVNAYLNDTGFPLTYDDQAAYNIWLANEAHARGLAIGLKNDTEQVADLLAYFDWALTESCFAQGWCDQVTPFIDAGKPVFAIEYTDTGITLDQFCGTADELNFNAILKNRNLDAYREACR